MFLLILLFLVSFVISICFLVYKIKLLEDDIETLYDKYSSYIENSYRRSDNNNA